MAAVTYPVWSAGQPVTAAMLNSMLPLEVVKPGTESVVSSTAMQNDDDLVAAVAANASYDFQCFLYYTAAAGPGDLKWQWTVPAGAGLLYQSLHNEGGGTGVNNSVLIYAHSDVVFAAGSGATSVAAHMWGTFVTAGSTGNLQLQWAQNTSSGTSTAIHTQSLLRLKRTA